MKNRVWTFEYGKQVFKQKFQRLIGAKEMTGFSEPIPSHNWGQPLNFIAPPKQPKVVDVGPGVAKAKVKKAIGAQEAVGFYTPVQYKLEPTKTTSYEYGPGVAKSRLKKLVGAKEIQGFAAPVYQGYQYATPWVTVPQAPQAPVRYTTSPSAGIEHFLSAPVRYTTSSSAAPQAPVAPVRHFAGYGAPGSGQISYDDYIPVGQAPASPVSAYVASASDQQGAPESTSTLFGVQFRF